MNRNPLYLTPGLAPLHPAVRAACARQVVNPRGSEFTHVYKGVEARLKKLLGTNQDVLLVSGSGTQAMETAVANVLVPDRPVLVVSQGEFGERFVQILRSYHANVHVLRPSLGTAVSAETLEESLQTIASVGLCVLVHVETSVGIRCDLPLLARAIRRCSPDCLIAVDAMTSLAAHEIRFDQWDLDVLVGAGHKAIGGPPGIGFITLSQRAWRVAEQTTSARFCSHLATMWPFHRQGQSQHVLPLPSLFGVEVALKLIDDVGITSFRSHLDQMAASTRHELDRLGMPLVAHESCCARSVTCAWMPEGVSARDLVARLSREHATEIATGRGKWTDTIIRIGHLGLANSMDQLEIGLEGLRVCLCTSTGAAVAAR